MALETFSDFAMDISVRTLLCNGIPYFCAKDVASALGYAKTRNAVFDHVFERRPLQIARSKGGPVTGPLLTE